MSILTRDIPEGYILGLGRDYPHPKIAHLYKGDFADPGLPMCKRGFNRDGGHSYSIWRGNMGENGVCAICLRRARKGLEGVPFPDDDEIEQVMDENGEWHNQHASRDSASTESTDA